MGLKAIPSVAVYFTVLLCLLFKRSRSLPNTVLPSDLVWLLFPLVE